jgi:5'-3' exonuclease
MGIKHFYSWFRKHETLKESISSSIPGDVDHLLIDMNGVIHEAAQQVFKYGKYAPRKSGIIIPKRRMKTPIKKVSPPSIHDLYKCVKSEINKLIDIAHPRKTVYLAIDGVAPMSKQNQQRQRRFRAAKEREEKNDDVFDSTCITAGTEFMRELSQNITVCDWVISKNQVNIIISDDSEPGEGEHKLMDWIKLHDNNEDVYYVVGMDADLILLCSTLTMPNVYIMRENEKRYFDFINIDIVRKNLPVSPHDLIIWSCFIGNDFLPPIPSLEIKESSSEIGALDFFFENYQKPLVETKHGYLKIGEIVRLLKILSKREKNIMEARHKDENLDEDDYNKRFPNPLWKGDIEQYRIDYREYKLERLYTCPDNFYIDDLIYDYMKTVQWVYLYYTKGINATKAWDWFYPYHYTLHANSFVECIRKRPIISHRFKKTKPSHPHEQILRVIPSSSKYLIPVYLHEYAERLAERYTTFEIDKSGKRQEWEAITVVDFVMLEEGIIKT